MPAHHVSISHPLGALLAVVVDEVVGWAEAEGPQEPCTAAGAPSDVLLGACAAVGMGRLPSGLRIKCGTGMKVSLRMLATQQCVTWLSVEVPIE